MTLTADNNVENNPDCESAVGAAEKYRIILTKGNHGCF